MDRLIDLDPINGDDIDQDHHQKLKDLRRSVRQDLENLLNTRLKIIEPADEYRELESSLLNYGVPDLATVNIYDIEKRSAFIHQLEQLILRFEPRFKNLQIHYIENKDSIDRTLRFRIDATLYADPSPEVVVFDSILEPVTRSVNIEDASHG